MPLPRCFFDVSINGVPSGRIIFELFKEDCPKTVENFRCLCTGEKGEGRTTFKPLHYKGTPIHRIVKGFIIQGGDFSNGDGTGGESIYGGMFKDETFKHKHDKPFLLSMANKGQHTNGSQFFITTRPAPHLDGIHVIFGHVISGMQFVTEIENQKVDSSHRPYADIRITHCGELVLVKKGKAKKREAVESSSGASSDEDSSSEGSSSSETESETDSEEERRRRRKEKKRRLKKKRLEREALRKLRKKKLKEKKGKAGGKKEKRVEKRKKKRSKKHQSSSEDSDSENEPVTSTVPEIETEPLPPELKSERPSWLYRRSRTPSPMEAEDRKKQRVVTTRQAAPSRHPNVITRKNEVSQSGRKLKGRGQMRYRTPPKFGSDDDDDLRSELQSNRPSTWREGGGEGRYGRQYDRRRRNDSDSWRSRSQSRDRERGRDFSSRNSRHQRDDKEGGEGKDKSRSPPPPSSRVSRWGARNERSDGEKPIRKFSERREDQSGRDDEKRGSRFSRRSNSRGGSGDERLSRRWSHHSRSPDQRNRHGYQRRPRRRFHSRSRSRSPGRGEASRIEEGQRGGVLRSKWARHHDHASSASASSDEEKKDKELERAYQMAADQQPEEDIFGLDKILA